MMMGAGIEGAVQLIPPSPLTDRLGAGGASSYPAIAAVCEKKERTEWKGKEGGFSPTLALLSLSLFYSTVVEPPAVASSSKLSLVLPPSLPAPCQVNGPART